MRSTSPSPSRWPASPQTNTQYQTPPPSYSQSNLHAYQTATANPPYQSRQTLHPNDQPYHLKSPATSRPTSPTPSRPTTPTSPQPHPAQLHTPSQQAEANKLYRQVVRRTTRNTLGVATSGAMSTVFPYMLGPLGASSYGLYKARKRRHEVIADLEAKGFHIRKRDLVNGVAVGALQKLPLTFLLWGHDEVFFAMGNLVETLPGHEHLLSGAMDVVQVHADGIEVPGLEQANGIMGAPVDTLHEVLGIDGAEERINAEDAGLADTGGWHDSAANVAADVAIVAPVAAAMDRIVDVPFDRYDQRRIGNMPGPGGLDDVLYRGEKPPPLPPRPGSSRY